MSSVNRDNCTSSFSILMLLFYHLAWLLCGRLLVWGWIWVVRVDTLVAVVQSPRHVRLFATPWTVACQASLSLISSPNLPKFMSIVLVIPFSHLILWCPLLFMPSIFPSIMDFSNESAVHFRWPKYWSFNFNISPSDEYSGLISLKIDWFHQPCVTPNLRGKSFQSFLIDYDIRWWRTGKPGML